MAVAPDRYQPGGINYSGPGAGVIKPNGNYWIGSDGNVWVAGDQGTNSAGVADDNSINYWNQQGYVQIADPVNRQQDRFYNTSGTGGSGGTGADRSGQNLAYDGEIGRLNSILGTYGTSRDQGKASVQDWYNSQYNSTSDDKARASRDFAQSRESAQTGRQKAYGEVDTGARTLNNSVRRILGLAGAGNSSASKFAAPNAISRDASGKRANVTDTYGRNLRGIDQAEGDTNLSFENVFSDLLASKKQKEGDVERNILEQEQGTYGNLANLASQKSAYNGGGYGEQVAARAPYQQEYDSRTGRIAALFDQYRTPVAVRDAKISTANLADYKVDKSAIAQNGNSGEYSPYSRFLKKRQEA